MYFINKYFDKFTLSTIQIAVTDGVDVELALFIYVNAWNYTIF